MHLSGGSLNPMSNAVMAVAIHRRSGNLDEVKSNAAMPGQLECSNNIQDLGYYR